MEPIYRQPFAALTDFVDPVTIATFEVKARAISFPAGILMRIDGGMENNGASPLTLTWRVKFGGTVIWEADFDLDVTLTTRLYHVELRLMGTQTGTQTLLGTIHIAADALATTGMGGFGTPVAPIRFQGSGSEDLTIANQLEVEVEPGSPSFDASISIFLVSVDLD